MARDDLLAEGQAFDREVAGILGKLATQRRGEQAKVARRRVPVSYTHLRAHETVLDLVCRLLLEKKNKKYT